MHTIDPDFILGIGRISEFGARKYHMRNFLMAPGMEWSRVYESLLRHLFLWWGGEENDVGPNGEFGETDDPETNMRWSGMPHLLHVAWNVMVLYTYSHRSVYHPGDDRPGVIEYDDGDWKEWRAEFDTAREVAVEDMPVPPVKRVMPNRPSYMRDPIRAAMTERETKGWGYEEQAKQAINEAAAIGRPINVVSSEGKTVITITHKEGEK